MTRQWLDDCSEDKLMVPPFDRFIYTLPDHIVKKRLVTGEVGYDGYQPDFSTLEPRDENELLAIDLVREYTNVPVPKLVYKGSGYNVFERLQGITVNSKDMWQKVHPKQKEAIQLQVRGYIQQLAEKVPSPGSVRSLLPSGEIFHSQLLLRGPFDSTRGLVEAYAKEGEPSPIAEIAADCSPVFSHMDWDLSNIILYPNMDAVMGVIDWERSCFFPEGGRSIHQMCIHQHGWETLFEGLTFPMTATT